MTRNKTVETSASVDAFLASVGNPRRREDARALVQLMARATGVEARMWGDAIVGFGKYTYRYESGREGEIFRVGFSPRKANLALYLALDEPDCVALLEQLGRYRTSAYCLYISKLTDVNLNVLESMVARTWELSIREHAPAA